MSTLSQLTTLLGWASLINIGYLLLSTFILIFMHGWITAIHSKLFRLNAKVLELKYFEFLSNFKVITMIFFVAPYFALKIMGY